MKLGNIKNVGVLIDWDNGCRMSGCSSLGISASKFIRKVILEIQKKCAEILLVVDGSSKYTCRIRVYHGWHRERTPTSVRVIFEAIINSQDFKADISRRFSRVIFTDEISFGNEMYGDVRYGMLYNTSRSQGQKMVDTALVCDALMMHNSGVFDSIIIVSDDDDFIPAVISSETLGYKTYLLRSVGRDLIDVSDIKSCASIKYWS